MDKDGKVFTHTLENNDHNTNVNRTWSERMARSRLCWWWYLKTSEDDKKRHSRNLDIR